MAQEGALGSTHCRRFRSWRAKTCSGSPFPSPLHVFQPLPLPRRNFLLAPFLLPKQTLPETNGNACNAGYRLLSSLFFLSQPANDAGAREGTGVRCAARGTGEKGGKRKDGTAASPLTNEFAVSSLKARLLHTSVALEWFSALKVTAGKFDMLWLAILK